MKLSEKILTLRKRRGLSQEELAEKLGVSRQTVSRWELGSALPDAGNVLQLSKLFVVTADYLLNDEYESEQETPAGKAAAARRKKLLGWAAAALGVLGQLVIYLFSRAVEVVVPRENARPVIDHNYKYFIREYDLEVLSAALWLLIALGLFVVADWKALKEKWKQWKKKKEEET